MTKNKPCKHKCRDFLEKEDPSYCLKIQNICVKELGQDCYIRELEQQIEQKDRQISSLEYEFRILELTNDNRSKSIQKLTEQLSIAMEANNIKMNPDEYNKFCKQIQPNRLKK